MRFRGLDARCVAFAAAASLCLAVAAQASDGSWPPPPGGGGGGMSVPSTGTYYEEQLENASWRATAESGLPSRLHVVDGAAYIEYRPLREGLRQTEWEVQVRDFDRRHETVDAVYDMVLVLPLPESAAGLDAFEALEPGITLREGDEPMIYGGRELVLKRNLALERTLVAGLIEEGGGEGKLPSLAGTGYRYTCWDAVVAHDAEHGEFVRAGASLRYATEGRLAAPDAEDDRLAAYWITWIPSLTTEIAPYALRMDVRD